jgi:ATP-dependent DNA helicase PIF1
MINISNLEALEGQRYTYKASLVYSGKTPTNFKETSEQFQKALRIYDNDGSYILELEIAIDAQVMLVANIDPDNGLVNGSRGVVIGFSSGASNNPIVEFQNGMRKTIGPHCWLIEEYEFVSRSQIPLRLAYAQTIHKSQGSTLDAALVDIGLGTFEYGQAYVALSRARSLDALYVHEFHPNAFKAHPRVKEFYNTLQPAINIDTRITC